MASEIAETIVTDAVVIALIAKFEREVVRSELGASAKKYVIIASSSPPASESDSSSNDKKTDRKKKRLRSKHGCHSVSSASSCKGIWLM